MNNVRSKFITRTAILLALTIVFQMLGRVLMPFIGPNSNFVVGPLVNACLIVSAASVGVWGGAVIAFIAPFGAVITGAAVPLPFVPFVGAGNFLLVLMFCLFKKNNIAGIFTGAFLKFGFLLASIIIFLRLAQIKSKVAAALFFSFSWPQLVTALLGGFVALIVIKALGNNIMDNNIKS